MSTRISWPAKLKAAILLRIGILCVALLVLSIAACLGAFHRSLELLSHFRLQYLACATLGAAVLLWGRRWKFLAVAGAAFAINAAEILPWYFGKPPAADPAVPVLKLLLCNVHTDNTARAPLLNLIAAEQPDLIVLEELDHFWVHDLSSLAQSYPASKTIPRGDNFGIGLWTRLPAVIEAEGMGEDDVPSLIARFQWQGHDIALHGAHTLPPIHAETFELRNAQLKSLAEWARALPCAGIVLGDLNCTPFSPYHSRLLRDSGLRNARRGFGILPSWPMIPTWLAPMRIPIDHCLISPGLQVRSIRTGPRVGSDHLPLIVELVAAPSAAH